MPRSFTATMIVLLPKKESPRTWSDYRPISLCNVSNKIITKILSERLAPLLPRLTALNQIGFVKGRLLSDNVLLAQEIIRDLGNSSPTPNVAIKLDMAKAYDRVQWPFLLKILRKMGFKDDWISLIERSINSCWFSVLINGAAAGFFKSSRGLRQGDPLSPSLFILAAEYLSSSLDKLILGRREMRYATTLHGLGVSHLAYADDIIVFTQANQESLQELIVCLNHYAASSGQKINMEKSHFFVDDKHDDWAPNIEAIGGFQRGSFPFIYLGVPIFKGRKKTDMFLFLREKISSRIHSWSHKHLSFGGRLTLIKSTLGAIPLHVFQVLEPTKEALKQMEGIFARFFWGTTQEKKATHWINWDQICLPFEEGGLGIRKSEEMVEAFGIKLWIRFREQDSLWAKFMMQKYCRNNAPSKVPFSRKHSLIWKRMTRAGGRIHKHIHWALGDGEINFWEDIWWGDKAISEFCNPGSRLPAKKVKDFWSNGEWNEPMVRSVLEPLGVPSEAVAEIIKIPLESGGSDTLRWACSAHGNFNTGSAWEICRSRQPLWPVLKLIWSDCILPSTSIFVWRLLANRIPVDAKLQWRKISIASKCRCCRLPDVETREHLFLQGEVARQIWARFADWFPNLPRWNRAVTDLEKRIIFWHRWLGRLDKPHAAAVIPCLVLWYLWSERNNHIHQGTVFTTETVFRRVKQHLQQLTTSGRLGKDQWRGCDVVGKLEVSVWREKPRKQIKLIRWIPPDEGWTKLNIEGLFCATGAGAGGILRDEGSNIIRGFKAKISATSRVDAILQAVSFGLDIVGEGGHGVWIEMGDSDLAAMLRDARHGEAGLRHRISEIRNKLKRVNSKITYISREGNKVASHLAQQGCSATAHLETFGFQTAPNQVRAMARLDQLGLPNFQFR